MTERIEVPRTISAPAADVFAVLCDPQGHVAIDATGMLQSADGDPVQAVGDSFVGAPLCLFDIVSHIDIVDIVKCTIGSGYL